MKFSIQEGNVIKALNSLSELYRSEDGFVRITAEKNTGVFFKSNNYTISACYCDKTADIEENGTAIVEGSIFHALFDLQNKNRNIQFQLKENTLSVNFDDNTSYILPLLQDSIFEINEDLIEVSFKIKKEDLKQAMLTMIELPKKFVDHIIWKMDNERLEIIALNNNFVLWYNRKCLTKYSDFHILSVPFEFILMCYSFPFENDELEFYVTNENFVISDGGSYLLTGRLTPIDFDVEYFTPVDTLAYAEFNKEQLSELFEQVRPFAEKYDYELFVRFIFENNKCTCLFEKENIVIKKVLTVKIGAFSDEISNKFEVVIKNGKEALFSAIKSIKEKTIRMNFTENGIIRIQTNMYFLYLIRLFSQTYGVVYED